MPLYIYNDLPAKKKLIDEKFYVVDKNDEKTSLSVLIVNLMPKKEETELQLLRLLGNSPLKIEVDLLYTSSHKSKNTNSEHLNKFYNSFNDICDKFYDAMIITGAPIEHLEFYEVDYWQELKTIFEWSNNHVYSTLHICWAAQARLYNDYGIKKTKLAHKIFGIFNHKINNYSNPLLRGFTDEFWAPHSRHTNLDEYALENCPHLEVLASSNEVGTLIASTKNLRNIFITGHIEYDFDTLHNEYIRDKNKGLNIELPYNYYPNNDENNKPKNKWKTIAYLFFNNWLNEISQKSHYSLKNFK